jgi:hypothetical protein
MKYFTPELWASWGKPGYAAPPPEEDPFALYRRALEALRGRLEPDVFAFFADADVHDGELIDWTVTDGSRPAPLGEPRREWGPRSGLPVRVALRVLDAWDRFIWSIRYTSVRRVEAKYASGEWGGGFDDWGYHELTDAGAGFLRHEILFASGSTILVEFRGVEVTRAQAREAAEQLDAADEARASSAVRRGPRS